MDPPSTTTTMETTRSDQLPPVPTNTSKLRLMCSYGGHIVPRPNDKSLFYANGETRIVAIDRRTTAASLSTLAAHLSRTLFNNRPFHLKYQFPDEDLDSLISVTTDEDLSIMLEEHDRISTISSAKPSRIRLFLFPVKPESVGSALLDQKAESWFSDALKNTGIVERGHSTDSSFVDGLMGLNLVTGPMEPQIEEVNNNTNKNPECMVLETSSSFGSTSSSVSMSNMPPIGVQCEESDKKMKVRVSSSASIESDTSVGSGGIQAYPSSFQEPRNQVSPMAATSFTIESENIVFDPSSMIQMQKPFPVTGYPDIKTHPEIQYIHGNSHYIPQYSTGPLQQTPYYHQPMYQIPMHQQHHTPYPVYYVPVQSAQSYNIAPNGLSGLPPHPQTGPMVYKEIITAQPSQTQESVAKVNAAAPQVSVAPEATDNYTNELDDNIAYTQIYKSQPPPPILPSQYQISTKSAAVAVSESTIHTNVN